MAIQLWAKTALAVGLVAWFAGGASAQGSRGACGSSHGQTRSMGGNPAAYQMLAVQQQAYQMQAYRQQAYLYQMQLAQFQAQQQPAQLQAAAQFQAAQQAAAQQVAQQQNALLRGNR